MGVQLLGDTTVGKRWDVSAQLYEDACAVIPGGVSANIKYFSPYPIFMERAHGSRLYDVDGHEYIDYLLGYGALILGHGHPKVVSAVMHQLLENGTPVFGTPNRIETDMARKLVELFPSMEMVRFTNSGMEATLLAIRVAQAYTGKRKIAKFEGHYHGGYNQVLFSINPDLERAGRAEEPTPVPESLGLTSEEAENTVILPFNQLDACEAILRRHADELAAVILEPVQGGFIPAEASFMKGLRQLTEELGIVLIFDEVKTGFRVTLGGVQDIYGIRPDLTALGKVLGGGFPVGAVGGKKDIMEIMSPSGARDVFAFVDSPADAKAGETPPAPGTDPGKQPASKRRQVLFHSGTYNGHPTVLAAGLATIRVLESPGTMERLMENTHFLRKQLENIYHKYGIPLQTVGMGSIFSLVITERPIKNYRDLAAANTALRKKLDYELLRLGVYTKPLNRYSMSVVHTKEDLHKTVEAHEEAVRRVMRP